VISAKIGEIFWEWRVWGDCLTYIAYIILVVKASNSQLQVQQHLALVD
jgi:hypothetical protein